MNKTTCEFANLKYVQGYSLRGFRSSGMWCTVFG